MRWPRRAAALGLAAAFVASADHVSAGPEDWKLPGGFSVTYQMELSHGESELAGGTTDAERIWENWLNADFTQGPINAGFRGVAFNPPDPIIFPDGPDSQGIDFAYAEYIGNQFDGRGGNFYALFGRGLALRSYENRTLRVDTNLLGGRAHGIYGPLELQGVIGQSVEGNAEDADRGRTEWIGGFDGDLSLPYDFKAGGSFVTTEVPNLGGEPYEPQHLKAGRLSKTLLGVDLYGEFARVDGPATTAGAEAPNVHGHGIYAAASTAIGRLGLVFDCKDYDQLLFNNAAGIAYILPPAVLREHQYNLLNRHPHTLSTADEVGFQIETTYNTEGITERGMTSFLANWSLTRNHDTDVQQGNHFDDVYAEVQQELGHDVHAIAGLSYQRSFDSPLTPDPFLTLWTPIADLRFPIESRYALGLHLQYEHQHSSSDRLGSFDTDFGVIELSRSQDVAGALPGWLDNLLPVSTSLLFEHSNKSQVQMELQNETDSAFIAGEVSFQVLERNEVTLFLGARNAGFVCVGGVCRQEPAFDGAELRVITRF